MWRSHSRAVATTPSRQPVEQPETAQHEPALPAVDDVEVRCGQQMRQRHDADLTGRRDQPHRGTGQRGDGVLSAVKDHPIREVQHTPPGQNRSPLPTGDGRAFCQRLGHIDSRHVRRSSPTARSGYARRCSRPASRTATAPAASSPKPAPTPTSASSATTSPPASSSSRPANPARRRHRVTRRRRSPRLGHRGRSPRPPHQQSHPAPRPTRSQRPTQHSDLTPQAQPRAG